MKTSDKIISFTAIFISCLALITSISQTRIMQKQSQAAVWPRLSNGQGIGPDYYIYSVTNEGVGPAIVSDIEFIYKDTSFQKINKLIHYFGDLEVEEKQQSVKLNFNYTTIYPGAVIRPAESNEIFVANDSISVMIGKKYLQETDIILSYCSIYESCWKMHNDTISEIH